MNSFWKKIVPVFLIGAILGAAAGALCQRRAARHIWEEGFDAQGVLRELSGELSLDAKQQAGVKKIVERHHEKVAALSAQNRERFADIRIAMRADIAGQLSADQQRKFEGMVARWEARHPNRLASPRGPEAP